MAAMFPGGDELNHDEGREMSTSKKIYLCR